MAKFWVNIADRWQQQQHQFRDHWERLQPRDRFALTVLMIFLTVTVLGGLLWFSHHMANQQQQRLEQLKSTIQWMQTQAVQLPPQSSDNLTVAEKIQRTAQQLGLSLQSQDTEGQSKLTVSHPNYSVLANFLMQLAAQGITIEQMSMQKQSNGQIQLTATVS